MPRMSTEQRQMYLIQEQALLNAIVTFLSERGNRVECTNLYMFLTTLTYQHAIQLVIEARKWRGATALGGIRRRLCQMAVAGNVRFEKNGSVVRAVVLVDAKGARTPLSREQAMAFLLRDQLARAQGKLRRLEAARQKLKARMSKCRSKLAGLQ